MEGQVNTRTREVEGTGANDSSLNYNYIPAHLDGVVARVCPPQLYRLPGVLVSPAYHHGNLDGGKEILGQRPSRVGDEVQEYLSGQNGHARTQGYIFSKRKKRHQLLLRQSYSSRDSLFFMSASSKRPWVYATAYEVVTEPGIDV